MTGKEFQLGTTNEELENKKQSTSGARLWMSGPAKLVDECFSLVMRLLPQSNFDDADDNHAVCLLTDGRYIKWSYMSDERVRGELDLPLPGVWTKMSVKECVQAITVASRRAEPWPNNSQPRQLLTKLAGEVAHMLLTAPPGLGVGSYHAPELVAASRALQEVDQVSHEEVPPPPPPGSHNSELFPELDTQVFDDDLRDAVNACEADYGGQTEHDADTQEDDDDKKEAEEDDADDSDSDAKGIARHSLSLST